MFAITRFDFKKTQTYNISEWNFLKGLEKRVLVKYLDIFKS